MESIDTRGGNVTVLLRDVDSGVGSFHVTTCQRVAARVLADRLDRLLAAGASPEGSILLAVRAHALVTDRHRQGLATAIDRVVTEAAPVGPRPVTAVPVNWAAVLIALPELRELAGRLRAPAPVPARGVAIVRRLLTDGCGPLFHPARAAELPSATRRASASLEPLTLW
jgi:hypothetical protein